MEMWLKRTTLVLLAVAALVVSGKDVIIQTQRRAEVPAGSSVTFLCPVTSPCHGTLKRCRLEWFLNPSGPSWDGAHKLSNDISNNSEKSSTKVSNKTKQDVEKQIYTLINATKNDTGWYFCKLTIEIPVLNIIKSNGTELVITESKELTTYPSLPKLTGKQATVSPIESLPLLDLWMWISLGVSTFILIVLLVVCLLLRRRHRRSRAEDPIYANTRPVANKQPSPRPGVPVDTLKKASSSQNLRNPSQARKCHEDKRRCKL
ncbi:uncharacterized protein isoform X1 [Notothenia coriiceps]|uniref:Uncharacterized protein LOC104948158 isoform X1 n=1 Tax=Notothenia coriiceps TaxID=8208 RepID=A0A6I9NE31_9TELE|nr:PREDICTED: uncharacterized protein LOC104948158 isoform X1 [Notothenia coriiceps]XP_010772631.1 PREDICTED: uncharacterized protein LOC104948158 isoform X1 [Notothenia coriiceps]